MGDIEVKSYDNVSQVAVGGCSKHSTITNLVGNNPMMQRRFAAYTLMLYCGEVMYPTRCAQSDLLVRGSYTNVIKRLRPVPSSLLIAFNSRGSDRFAAATEGCAQSDRHAPHPLG